MANPFTATLAPWKGALHFSGGMLQLLPSKSYLRRGGCILPRSCAYPETTVGGVDWSL